MRKDKVKAYELRRQQKSYAEISHLLSIPKSTLATWFQNQEWSQKIRDELGAKVSFSFPKSLAAVQRVNKERWAKAKQTHREEARKEFEHLKSDPLFIAGVMLYWGEGDKTDHSMVKFANSDPRMISVFYSFLRKRIRVPEDKINAYLLLYPDLNDAMQRTFWQRATGIPKERFWKSIVIKGKHPTRRLSYGVCNINVGSRALKERLLTWINLYQEFLV